MTKEGYTTFIIFDTGIEDFDAGGVRRVVSDLTVVAPGVDNDAVAYASAMLEYVLPTMDQFFVLSSPSLL